FGALAGATTGSMTGATTGSEFSIDVSVWTTEGWTSLVLPLLVGDTVSYFTSVSRSTTLGREEEVVGIVGVDELELGNPRLDKMEAVLTMTSSLEELVSSLVVPLRMMISLIFVLVLKVLILIVLVLILIKPWWSKIIVRMIA
nr:hypothetical protein [Tanacetum cinerariifolium]